MVVWEDFVAEAPTIAEVFVRRHQATGLLCMLATIRSDGFPRISPMEPRIFEGQLTLVGMPDTMKFRDLKRDPRFCLHTATVDSNVGEGDVKLWGTVTNLRDRSLHERFADRVYQDIGLDLRGHDLDPYYVARLTGASALAYTDGQLVITSWKPGQGERVIHK
jgi:hypothetical protein